MGAKIDRTGETKVNNFGSEMVIIKYKKWEDVDIYFPEYNWTAKNKTYQNFKNGQIKCPYERNIYAIGYIGEGKYKVSENGKNTRAYKTWNHMLERCYNEKNRHKNPTYKNCNVSKEFHNFQNFGYWDENNYYDIEGEKMCLDKDILVKHNKIYTPDNCVYVPNTINTLFTKNDSKRGTNPIGVSNYKNGKYVSQCNLINPKTGKSKNKYLGLYETQEKAFEVYKYYKEKNIKEVADYYKGQIPQEVYDVLYAYEVEIDD